MKGYNYLFGTTEEIYNNEYMLFVINSCEHCRLWKEFIEKKNMKLPLDKQIQVIDCTRYYEFGIIDHPLIIKYKKKLGSFPIFMYHKRDTKKIFTLEGGNTREELEDFINGLFYNEFKFDEANPYYFNKSCRYVKSGVFRKRLLCG